MAPTDREKKRAQLRAKHPETWISVNPGDELIGKVVDITAAWSDVKNDFYPLLTIEANEATGYETPATLKVHAMPTVLFNEIVRQEPRPGEAVKIVYVGTASEARVRGQNPAEQFRVEVHGRDPQEVADRVYAGMRDKIRRAPTEGDGNQAPAPDVPADDDDLPFD